VNVARGGHRPLLAPRWVRTWCLAGLAATWTLAGGAGLGWANAADQEYTIDAWETEEGLPQSSVVSIAQTPDGYLWLATFDGLARFDGARFTVVDASNLPGLPSNRLLSLFVDWQGALWLTTEFHHLVRLAEGRCQVFGAPENVPSDGVGRVAEDAANRLWIADQAGGLYRMETGQFVPVVKPPGLGQGTVSTMIDDREGQFWVRQGDRLARFEGGELRVLEGPRGEAEAVVKYVWPSREGGLWVVTSDGVRQYRKGQWVGEPYPCPAFATHITGALEDPTGDLWLATYGEGLHRLRRPTRWQHFTTASGLTTDSIRSLFVDREGNVWVGTDGGGLLRVKRRGWGMITRRQGLGISAVHSVCEDPDGRVWFGGGTTKPYWLDQGKVSVAIESPVSDPLKGVFAVLAARDGAMWIGTYGQAVFRYQEGRLARFAAEEGMLAGPVRAMIEDRQGGIWVGGFAGLCRIRDGRVTDYSQADGFSGQRVWALAEDSAGTLYVGTSGGGLYVLREGKFTRYTRRDGLPDDYVRALYVDAQDTLWIGTRRGGLSRFREGRFVNYAVKGGVSASRIGPILEDDAGWFWLGSDLGILRVSGHDLEAFARDGRRPVNYVTFNGRDGLATTECSSIQPGALKTRAGTLWFGTSKGAAFVDPRQLRVDLVPPPVVIEEVLVDDVVVGAPNVAGGQPSGAAEAASPLLPRCPSRLTLRPRQHRLEVRFSGLEFTAAEKVRFRYLMEGLDDHWVDGGASRSAHYTRLPPGEYRFRVTACNSSGVWNQTGAALGVVVLPAYYQTWWFRALVVLGVGGLVLGWYERRLHHSRRARVLQETFSRRLLESQEQERARIAAGLHDSLGQSVLLIKNRAALGLEGAANLAGTTEQLDAISRLAGRAIEEIREIAYDLRPYQLDRLGLTRALEAVVRRVTPSCPIQFEVAIDDVNGLFAPVAEINLFRILQEAVNNVVKHSRATRAEVRVARGAQSVRIEVTDNGQGFDLAAVDAAGGASRGMGMSTMAERVQMLGGTLRYESAPGQGTRLGLTVPIPPRVNGPSHEDSHCG